jgi:hypothetical protein
MRPANRPWRHPTRKRRPASGERPSPSPSLDQDQDQDFDLDFDLDFDFAVRTGGQETTVAGGLARELPKELAGNLPATGVPMSEGFDFLVLVLTLGF